MEGEDEEEMVTQDKVVTSGGEPDEKEKELEVEILEKYGQDFNPLKQEILDYILKPKIQYKVRVYVLSC